MPVPKRDATADDRGAREFDRAGNADPPVDGPIPAERQAVAVCDGRRTLSHFAVIDGAWRAWRAPRLYASRSSARRAITQVSDDWRDLAELLDHTNPPDASPPVCWRTIPESDRLEWLLRMTTSCHLSLPERIFAASFLGPMKSRQWRGQERELSRLAKIVAEARR